MQQCLCDLRAVVFCCCHGCCCAGTCHQVASRLWQLLVVQAGLMQHLAAIKDYALLARGDFYQCFLADASKLLAGPPRDNTVNSDLCKHS